MAVIRLDEQNVEPTREQRVQSADHSHPGISAAGDDDTWHGSASVLL
jgi:hypothetical protein